MIKLAIVLAVLLALESGAGLGVSLFGIGLVLCWGFRIHEKEM